MHPDTKASIRSFLLSVKYASRPWVILSREKNEATKFELVLTDEEVIEEVRELSVQDYCYGPCKDEDEWIEGDVWVFGKTIKERQVYIKLKLSGDEQGQAVKVLSFHFPERPMKYQFK